MTTDTLPGNTLIETRIDGNNLLIVVRGTSYSIANCGEQLAWLCAALSDDYPTIQNSEFPKFPQRSPTVRLFSASVLPREDLDEGGGKRTKFRVQTRIHPSSHVAPSALLGVFGSCSTPTVICGFPIRRRPESCPAIEVSAAILLRAIGSPILVITTRLVVQLGHDRRLELVGRDGEMFFWQSARSTVLCTHFQPYFSKHETVGGSEIKSGRHFVCEFDGRGSWPKWHSTDPGGEKIDDTGSARVDSSDAETTSRSPSTDNSSSLDPEMLSIPSGSGTIDSGGDGSKLGVQVFRAVFARLIQHAIHIQEVEYDQPMADLEGPSQDADGPQRRQNQISNSTSTSSSTTMAKRTGKRKAQDINQGSEDREDDDDESPKTARPNKLPPSPLGPRYLACPFWKLDSAAHFECPLFQLDTISHVKQHLARRHTPAHYCQRCYAQFGSDSLLDVHINGTFCSRRANARLAGISYDQRRRLSMKSAKGPEVQQWHVIWDILFTGVEHPACVYVYPKQLVELRTIRQFSLQEGQEILTQELQARGMALRSDVGAGEQQLQEALLSGLTIIFDRFIQRLPGDVEDDKAPTALGLCEEPRSTASSDLPPLESRADGGLGLGPSSNASDLFPPMEQPRIFPNRLPGVGDDPSNPSVPRSSSRFEASQDAGDGPRAPWSPGYVEEASNANLATNDIRCFSEFSDNGGMPHWDPPDWQANQTLEDILGTIAVMTSQEGLVVNGSELGVSDIPSPDAPP